MLVLFLVNCVTHAIAPSTDYKNHLIRVHELELPSARTISKICGVTVIVVYTTFLSACYLTEVLGIHFLRG
jgi:hypothetical protein